MSKQKLSRKDQSYLNLALKIAESSECVHRHGAVVVKGGRVMAIGVNKWRNRHGTVVKTDTTSDLSVHAEVDALSRVSDARGAILYVARVSKRGTPLLSRPCRECYSVIRRNGLKRVVYSYTEPD
jgi:deoxycytidylate deaminase